jgi:hypothetical protein
VFRTLPFQDFSQHFAPECCKCLFFSPAPDQSLFSVPGLVLCRENLAIVQVAARVFSKQRARGLAD